MPSAENQRTQLLARIPSTLHRDVRKLSIDENTTMANLVEEALYKLLQSRGRDDAHVSEAIYERR